MLIPVARTVLKSNQIFEELVELAAINRNFSLNIHNHLSNDQSFEIKGRGLASKSMGVLKSKSPDTPLIYLIYSRTIIHTFGLLQKEKETKTSFHHNTNRLYPKCRRFDRRFFPGEMCEHANLNSIILELKIFIEDLFVSQHCSNPMLWASGFQPGICLSKKLIE